MSEGRAKGKKAAKVALYWRAFLEEEAKGTTIFYKNAGSFDAMPSSRGDLGLSSKKLEMASRAGSRQERE